MQDDDEILTLKECAALLKMPVSALYRFTAAKAIPTLRHKDRRQVWFSKKAVLAWMLAQAVPATGELPKRKKKPAAAVAEARQDPPKTAIGRPGRDFPALDEGKTPAAIGNQNGRGRSLISE